MPLPPQPPLLSEIWNVINVNTWSTAQTCCFRDLKVAHIQVSDSVLSSFTLRPRYHLSTIHDEACKRGLCPQCIFTTHRHLETPPPHLSSRLKKKEKCWKMPVEAGRWGGEVTLIHFTAHKALSMRASVWQCVWECVWLCVWLCAYHSPFCPSEIPIKRTHRREMNAAAAETMPCLRKWGLIWWSLSSPPLPPPVGAAWICITKASCSIDPQWVKAVYQQMSLSLGKTMGD